MFKSIWNEIQIEKRPTLQSNLQREVAIVGGGMAGILIAYHLQKLGKQVVILEADRIGHGITLNTTAKITSQHNLIYHYLEEGFGLEKAREYAEYNEHAISQYESVIKEEHMDCDFERKDAYVYTLQDTNHLKAEAATASKLGIEAVFTEETALPFPVKGAVKFANQAQFHPLKFIKAIAGKLEIYEQTTVEERKGEHTLIATTEQEDGSIKRWKIEAEDIILANHYPFEKLKGLYATRMYQEREDIVVVKAKDALPYGMYIGADNTGNSFRKYKDYLIVGGKSHRPGVQKVKNPMEELEAAVRQYYKEAEVCYRMVNQDCMTVDRIPYIGHYTKGLSHVYIATGFNKWGMSGAMVSALILSEMIGKKEEKEDSIFSPQRLPLKGEGTKEEWANHITTVLHHFTLQKLPIRPENVEELKPEQGMVIKYHGKHIAVYCDKDGEYHCFSARCPHLGCLLEWNQEEKSWDCPCHGSHFDALGNLVCGPALEEMKKKAMKINENK